MSLWDKFRSNDDDEKPEKEDWEKSLDKMREEADAAMGIVGGVDLEARMKQTMEFYDKTIKYVERISNVDKERADMLNDLLRASGSTRSEFRAMYKRFTGKEMPELDDPKTMIKKSIKQSLEHHKKHNPEQVEVLFQCMKDSFFLVFGEEYESDE